MSQGPPAKKVLRGTTSCIQCKLLLKMQPACWVPALTCSLYCTGRHRKIRRVWPSGEAKSCQSCLDRDRACKLQVHMVQTSDAVAATSRVRIGRLESDVSSLWTAVQNLETKLEYVPTEPNSRPSLSSQSENEDGPREKPSNSDGDSDSNSRSSNMSSTNPPTHLIQLFDNRLLGSCVHGISATGSRHMANMHKLTLINAFQERYAHHHCTRFIMAITIQRTLPNDQLHEDQ